MQAQDNRPTGARSGTPGSAWPVIGIMFLLALTAALTITAGIGFALLGVAVVGGLIYLGLRSIKGVKEADSEGKVDRV
jgi:hypothetical protein